MKFVVLVIIFVSSLPVTGGAAEHEAVQSLYSGQEKREIKSLSPSDVEQLLNGGGWGLAKAAELNGMPGPKHLLEMKQDIALTKEQEEKIHALFLEMKSDAIRLGGKLVELEKSLDDSFAEGTITPSSLAEALDRIAVVRRDLRYVHLAAHLQTPDILTPAQIATYNQIRGYGSMDPCGEVPEGHDVNMWRQHNGCE